jgi:hypothetical protein
MKYASMMVAAYQGATGKTEHEALQELGIDGLLQEQDLKSVSDDRLLSALVDDAAGVKSWRRDRRKELSRNPIRKIVDKVLTCPMCHSLSGCILSDLKGMTKSEIIVHLSQQQESWIEKILDYQSHCPYKDRVRI